MYQLIILGFIFMIAICDGSSLINYPNSDVSVSRHHRRATSTSNSAIADFMNIIHTGVLGYNNAQTFCAVIPITETYMFVAASCFTTDDGSSPSPQDYSVYMVGFAGTITARYISKIKIHTHYDPTTFANNIAIITVDDSQVTPFTNYIGSAPFEWSAINYVENSMSEDLSSWNSPNVVLGGSTNADDCTSASSLYSANTDFLTCDSHTTKSYFDSNCVTPYRFAIGTHFTITAPVALYSYSSISGSPSSGFCSSGNKIISYFTVLYDYVSWAESVTSLTISVQNANMQVTKGAPASKPMKEPSSNADDGGAYIYSLYGQNQSIQGADTDDSSQSSSSISYHTLTYSIQGGDSKSQCTEADQATLTLTARSGPTNCQPQEVVLNF